MGKVTGLTFPAAAPEQFLCPHCGKTYQSQAPLDKHIRDKHPEPPAEEQ